MLWCQFWPEKWATFLGFEIDMEAGTFMVPQKKIDQFFKVIRTRRKECEVAATLVGLLVSFAPALQVTPILTRCLRQAAEKGTVQEESGLDMPWCEFIAEHFNDQNGKHWPQLRGAAVGIRMVADTSEQAYVSVAGGVTELGDWKMSVPFTAEEMSRMESGTFSSTEREVRGTLKALQEFKVAFPERLEPGVRVQILGDNQAACSDCERTRGTKKVSRR
jgi:hypothetical protein